MGNICRSPTAHAVMESLIKKSQLDWVCDSAGIISYHQGQLPDSRMRKHALKRGYELVHLARGIRYPEDFEQFDFIFYMDDDNFHGLCELDRKGEYSHKLKRLTDFCHKDFRRSGQVPDPYYGGDQGFELVLDIIEEGCQGILLYLQNHRAMI